jgi:sec-independent protein translocase protein TatC
MEPETQGPLAGTAGSCHNRQMSAVLARLRPPDDDRDPDGREGEISFLDHLEELRKRIINSLIAVAVAMVVAFMFIDRIVNFMLEPAVRMLPPGSKLIYTEPTEAFVLDINVALIAGIVLAAPVIMYQFWLFVAPGLYAKEKRLVIPFVLLTTLGVICGGAFGHYIVFPSMIAFFGTFNTNELAFMPKLRDTFDLYIKMVLGMCVVFQIPTVVYFLARMGVVNASFLWKHFRYAILLAFIAAAILTPSADPWNQTVFAGPMIGLYILSIGIAWMVQPKKLPAQDAKDADDSDASQDSDDSDHRD